MDYFGARYYSGERGRFTTVDPVFTWEDNLVDPQRWNRYAYVRNNPLRYTDPDGEVIFDVQEFKTNVSLAMKFGQDGYGYLVPTVAVFAAAGSVAGDVVSVLTNGHPMFSGGCKTGRKRSCGKVLRSGTARGV